MSGAYCEGCGEGNLLQGLKTASGRAQVVCDLCGWTADADSLTRKWMDDGDAPPWTKRERKKAGTLFFLWIDFDPKSDDAVGHIMQILELDGLSIAPKLYIELPTRPSDATLDQLRKVPTVTRVWLVP